MRDLALFAVTVMNQETRFHSRVIEPHAGITGLLHDPVAGWIVSRGAAVNLAAAQVKKDEHIGCQRASGCVDSFREEVGADQRVHVRMDIGRPRNSWPLEGFVRRRMNAGTPQNLLDGRCAGANEHDPEAASYRPAADMVFALPLRMA